MCSEDFSSAFGSRILPIFPILLEHSSFEIPERKLQSVFCHVVSILCSEPSTTPPYTAALICLQQLLLGLAKHATQFCKEHPKVSSSKVADSIRSQPPKSLSGNVYCSVLWSVLQDLCARLSDEEAVWLSNGGDLAAVRLTPHLCLEMLAALLPACDDVLQNRIEFSSLLQYIVSSCPRHDQFFPAGLRLLKSEQDEATYLLLLQVLLRLCSHHLTVLPAVGSLLSEAASQVKRIVSKKQPLSESRFPASPQPRSARSSSSSSSRCSWTPAAPRAASRSSPR